MRKVRGRNKLSLDELFRPVLICFLAGSLGVLLGFLIGKVSSLSLVIAIAIIAGILLTSLIIGQFVNSSFKMTLQEAKQDSYSKQCNALQIIISELEENMKAKEGKDLQTGAWKILQYEVSLFPNFLYEDLLKLYSTLENIKKSEDDNLNITKILHEDLDMITIMARLRAEQNRVRRNIWSI